MGITAFMILVLLEIGLVVWTFRRKPDKEVWRRKRLILRAAEVLAIVLHLVCSAGQKWRFIPVLALLGILLIVDGLSMLMKGKGKNQPKKTGGAIVSCLLCILFSGLLLVPAFLFTDYNGLPVSGQHQTAETSAILIDQNRTDPFEEDGSFREVPVHFYYPADAPEGEKFPLVVFSHGAFGYYQSNTSTYQELASNGYVVVALDHPHHAFFTEDTEGKMVLVDTTFLDNALNLNSVTDQAQQFALYQEWMSLRTADMGFALDALETAVTVGKTGEDWFLAEKDSEKILAALRMTDTTKIGLMGHSMGGATSVELGRTRDDVTAVIDLDGTMLGEYVGVQDGELLVRDDPYPLPVLDFNNWDSSLDIEQYIAQGHPYPNAEVIAQASDGFSVAIRDTKHMDFTDLPLLSPFLGNVLGSGERDTEETMTIVNSLVLKFFDCYLKGEGVFTANDTY